ncbi:MAG: toxin-antitoxin system YwqK family antitoxin [Bacteroidales bacterium]|jgi:antitoxin component YwqK of YwqJK toxin-antitoxin module|nr:toxin-antitoxin system YwqK family antitoxin [Bacteroidales bacterium]
MKSKINIVKFFVIIIILDFFVVNNLFAQRCELHKGSKVNCVDDNNKKQGEWLSYYDTLQTLVSSRGNYVNDIQQGVWTYYYRNGNIKYSLTYVNGVVSGPAKVYYPSGIVQEEGTWDNGHWVGDYKFFYSNGKLAQDFDYDNDGSRNGVQKYYFESGKLRISGIWENDKRNGLLAEYYDSGKLRSESQWVNGVSHGVTKVYYEKGTLKAQYVYNNGVYDAAASKIYSNSRVVAENRVETPKPVVKQEKPERQEDQYLLFQGTGYRKLYSMDKRLESEGTFLNGQLNDGKKYYYNSKGDLIKVVVYEHGRVVDVIEK